MIYTPHNYIPIQKEFVQPTADSSFIFWLFKYRCVMCKRPAQDVNEIIPRSRWTLAAQEWKNRVPLCRNCHNEFHRSGVTNAKIQEMQNKRKDFLIAMNRMEYV